LYQNVFILDFIGAKDGAKTKRHANTQSDHHHQQNNTVFTGWMPFLSPNQQCQALKGTDDDDDHDAMLY